MPVFARNVVASSQPLATQAGIEMLRIGGNAIDATLATAIALVVVEPTNNGLGSDAFAQVWDGAQLHGLNASGRAPGAWTRERFAHHDAMPLHGWESVTVPGAVSGWVALSEKFGALPFARLFAPAISYARDGFAVSPITAQLWQEAEIEYSMSPELYCHWAQAFAPSGRAPQVGETFRSEDMARSLELIAQSNGEAFYNGELAEKIAAHSASCGGALAREDLASHTCDWVEPIGVDYRDTTLHEIPPNGQGLAALIALGILRQFSLNEYSIDSADSLHLQIEAMKLAFADVENYLGDTRFMHFEPRDFLTEEYLSQRAALVSMTEARDPHYGIPPHGGTVYLTAADASGKMVSFIQSNFHGFGSGVVVPQTGIALQNRGHGFVLREGHANCVAGGKRPRHTILPAFVTQNGAPLLSFGVMGGPMQPQGHVQMMTRLFDYGQNPQAACDAPRWRVLRGLEVSLESGFADETLAELTARGHQIVASENWGFGGAQLILKHGDGYCAASDGRKDGHAAGF